jgi:hypothetical protein
MKLHPSTGPRIHGSASTVHPRGYAAAPDEIFVRSVVLQAPTVVRLAGPVLFTLAALVLMVFVLSGVMDATAPSPLVWLS